MESLTIQQSFSPEILSQAACDPRLWTHEPGLLFLNHGSFGACPQKILNHQDSWRQRLERQPVHFLGRELEAELDAARSALAGFVGCAADDLVYVPNATTGVNTVLRSLHFQPRDELLVTDQEYNACRNALNFVAQHSGAKVVVAPVPFPFRNVTEVVQPILAAVSPNTKLALLDHVTSQTGLVMPIESIVQELKRRGVDVLVDGAHAPGMVPLHLEQLGAAYYTGNCHKWLCTPKGSALLYVRRDRQHCIRPLVISHGANSPRTDRSRFQIEFGWTGTCDPSAYLSVPETLRFIGSLLPGGWPEIMARNRALALMGRKRLCEALETPEPCPEEFIGSLAAVPMPNAPANGCPQPPVFEFPLQERLRRMHGIEVPIVPWPASPRRLVRIAAQLYNSLPQYERLAQALMLELKRERA